MNSDSYRHLLANKVVKVDTEEMTTSQQMGVGTSAYPHGEEEMKAIFQDSGTSLRQQSACLPPTKP